MKSMLKRAASAILVVAIALTTVLAVPTAEVEAASVSYPKTKTVYMLAKNLNSETWGADVIKVKTTKKVKSVKSSTKSVVIDSVDRYKKYTEIHFYAKKTVKNAKITFKVGSKKYTTKVTAKKYANPLKTLKISGVKSGSNIASKFKNKDEVDTFKLSKDTSGAKLTVKAASGWKLTSVDVWDCGATGNVVLKSKTYSKGTTATKKYSLGTLKGGEWYSVILGFKNKKTGGTQTIYLAINQ